jgi:Ca-activated chloride channel family protein
VGANGKAKYPATDIFGNVTTVMADVEIDEELLQSIAETTGGKYFRATNEKALSNIYDEINELEKSEVQVTTFFNLEEKFMPWIILAILLLGAEFIVARLILNRIP